MEINELSLIIQIITSIMTLIVTIIACCIAYKSYILPRYAYKKVTKHKIDIIAEPLEIYNCSMANTPLCMEIKNRLQYIDEEVMLLNDRALNNNRLFGFNLSKDIRSEDIRTFVLHNAVFKRVIFTDQIIHKLKRNYYTNIQKDEVKALIKFIKSTRKINII